MKLNRRLILATGLVIAGLSALPSWAQGAYPSKPISVVVSYPPGGDTDAIARLFADRLSQRLKQSVIVENKPGAGGVVGNAYVGRAAPDGYTLLFIPSGHASSAAMKKQLPFHPVNDFQWVSTITTYPLAFTVAPQSPIRSFQDLMQRAKAEPGKWSYSSVGVGTAMHLAAEWLQAESGVQLNHIPFKGGTGPMTELLAGRVDVMVDTMTLTAALLKDQRVRALAVTSPKGGSPLQGVPAVADFYPGMVFESWLGIAAPAATPAPVLERLNKALREVVAQPDVRQRLLDFGGQPQAGSSTEFRERVQRDILNLRKLVSERKIEPE